MAHGTEREAGWRRNLRRATAGAAAAAGWAAATARSARPLLRSIAAVLWRLFEALLALVIVFEEWGWKPLAAMLARLARLRPVAVLEAAIARLPPYPALAIFALPSLLLLPLKLAALWLIARGQLVSATLLFAGAKVAGTALLARIFQLTQPALMRLAWFAWTYNTVVPWKEALLAQLRASRAWRIGRIVKARLRKWAAAIWARWRPIAEAHALRLRALLLRRR